MKKRDRKRFFEAIDSYREFDENEKNTYEISVAYDLNGGSEFYRSDIEKINAEVGTIYMNSPDFLKDVFDTFAEEYSKSMPHIKEIDRSYFQEYGIKLSKISGPCKNPKMKSYHLYTHSIYFPKEIEVMTLERIYFALKYHMHYSGEDKILGAFYNEVDFYCKVTEAYNNENKIY